ncbi:unnamed protein product [Trichogramma brassicae]|uniref:Alpha N-terminal protein methyltransferase 1 n=1 Tax=Trichogramma brassicae TaxID=86971 RepID=A0A6H5I6K0_9HYME|nr:unnamed protein product [Trichogramma brassicae]
MEEDPAVYRKQVESFTSQKEFYEDAAKYWDQIPATVNGMLGGFACISEIDVNASKRFLKALFQTEELDVGRDYACDCGAGIGRVTGNLLSRFFNKVDLVEQNPKFLEQAKSYLKVSKSKVGEFYPIGLQDFDPEPKKYNVIWCQWVLGHLNDADLVKFFKNCKKGLKDNGILCVKENVTKADVVQMDPTDSSITRPYKELVAAFDAAGYTCIKEELQTRMPDGLYPVYMFALKPIEITSESSN